jgi:hypothetical protein
VYWWYRPVARRRARLHHVQPPALRAAGFACFVCRRARSSPVKPAAARSWPPPSWSDVARVWSVLRACWPRRPRWTRWPRLERVVCRRLPSSAVVRRRLVASRRPCICPAAAGRVSLSLLGHAACALWRRPPGARWRHGSVRVSGQSTLRID